METKCDNGSKTCPLCTHVHPMPLPLMRKTVSSAILSVTTAAMLVQLMMLTSALGATQNFTLTPTLPNALHAPPTALLAIVRFNALSAPPASNQMVAHAQPLM
uniref:Uncharacterized protein n=1 Tax=Spironucleus salmonicida TaxID=348837 RepID=V6LDT5_9EUKA|eukprot:EST42428.1 Hypothetical protein SS50377_17985 [Spironucleus salmonicida]